MLACLIIAIAGYLGYTADICHGASIRSVPNNTTLDPLDLQTLILYKLPDDNVAAVNKQVNLEFSAMYAYEAMAAFFDSANNPMPGCSKFFLKQADMHLNQARIFMTFLNLKGGKLFLPDIKAPTITSWETCMSGMQDGLRVEMQIRHALHDLAKRATKEADIAFEKLASNVIGANAKSIKHMADIIRQFLRNSALDGKADRGAAEFILDKELLKDDRVFSSTGLAQFTLD